MSIKYFALLLLLFTLAGCGPTGEVNNSDPYFSESNDTFSPPHNITRDILQDGNGIFWLATWEGIIKYDPAANKFTNVTLQNNLAHFHFFCALEDSKGNLWFGSIGAGAYRYDGKNFTHFSSANGLANDRVQCLLEDDHGNILFGTDGGISRYDGRTFASFTTTNGLCNDAVQTLEKDKSGIIWIGTSNGICKYDGKSFTPFLFKENTPFMNVRAIRSDSKGNIWIGSGDGGLYKYDGSTFTNITGSFTSYIYEDRSGDLWLSAGDTSGTSDAVPPKIGMPVNSNNNGMLLYKYDGKALKKIISKNSNNDYQVFRAMEDKEGNIWFGTMKGVMRYDGKTFTVF